ncbi:MAG: hypothetical protein NZM38_01530 [Cytophagales bacterium]|nr:hypothetical protein [Cytophagales bacterium]MDW8383432.1 hypothetical protein [Flammeovirgaceae bacterium]
MTTLEEDYMIYFNEKYCKIRMYEKEPLLLHCEWLSDTDESRYLKAMKKILDLIKAKQLKLLMIDRRHLKHVTPENLTWTYTEWQDKLIANGCQKLAIIDESIAHLEESSKWKQPLQVEYFHHIEKAAEWCRNS